MHSSAWEWEIKFVRRTSQAPARRAPATRHAPTPGRGICGRAESSKNLSQDVHRRCRLPMKTVMLKAAIQADHGGVEPEPLAIRGATPISIRWSHQDFSGR